MSVEFVITPEYRHPVGFAERGETSFCFVSRCGRWHARQGNFGTMVLTDRWRDAVHVITGKMPEIIEMVDKIMSAHPREYDNER